MGANRNSGSIVSVPSQSQGNSEMNEALLTQKRLNLMEAVRSVPVFTVDDPALSFTLFVINLFIFLFFFIGPRKTNFLLFSRG